MDRYVTREERMGNRGEEIIESYFNELKIPITRSSNKYDSIKDFILFENKTGEGKTQVPFVTKTCFTIKDNHQLTKCVNADYLIFVQAPTFYKNKNPLFNECAIYQIDKDFDWYRYTTKKKVKMILISMEQPKVRKLKEINGEDKEYLRKLGTKF